MPRQTTTVEEGGKVLMNISSPNFCSSTSGNA